jgi:hypothetical protein
VLQAVRRPAPAAPAASIVPGAKSPTPSAGVRA